MRNMTAPNPELEQLERTTRPGMAHWAGTGPDGASCGKCLNFGDVPSDGEGSRMNRDRCKKYLQMTGNIGGRLPKKTAACKYFEAATEPATANN